jgi:phage terminase large subunit-like protein
MPKSKKTSETTGPSIELGSWSRFIPITPTPRQLVFLAVHTPQVLYGGAAGGGKSAALLAAALQYAEHPGYSALLIRRTFADLAQPGALITRSQEWLGGTAARWDSSGHRWTFPSGATLTFGYLDSLRDKFRYQSAEFQFIGFDEATQFVESDYTYLFSRLRRLASSNVPLRMRAASNPGGIGHEWVRRRFVDPSTRDHDAAFIPAALADNPHLDQASYIASLSRLDPVTRRQLLSGDWTARQSGGMFRREWLRVFPADADLGRSVAESRSWDLAATEDGAHTVGVRMARLLPGAPVRWLIRHAVRGQWTPGQRDLVIAQTAAADGRGVKILPEQEPGSGGIAQVESLVRALSGYWVEPVRPTGPKRARAGPFCSQAEFGHIGIVAGPWITWYLDALESFDQSGLDEMDATSCAFTSLADDAAGPPPDLKIKLPASVLGGMMPRLRRADDWDDD